MKKGMWLSLVLAVFMLVATACGANNADNQGSNKSSTGAENVTNTDQGDKEVKKYKIAVSQFVEHASLDAIYDGIIDALAEAGLKEGENLEIDYQNSQADFNNLTPITEKIVSGKPDLAVGIATPNAISLVDAIKDTPVVFAGVTDPLDAKLVPSLVAPGGNVTGASDTNPDAIVQLMDFIATELPDVKTVGIVINKSEQNAVVMADIAKEALDKHGIKVIEAAIANSSDIQTAAQSLVGRVDAIYITLDNTVVEGVDPIIDVANENDIPFFSADRDTVEKGAFATVGFKYYDHGFEAGQIIADILLNGKNPGEINVSKPEKLDFIFNMSAAAEQGITVTDAMKAYVKNPSENVIE